MAIFADAADAARRLVVREPTEAVEVVVVRTLADHRHGDEKKQTAADAADNLGEGAVPLLSPWVVVHSFRDTWEERADGGPAALVVEAVSVVPVLLNSDDAEHEQGHHGVDDCCCCCCYFVSY